MVKILLVGFEPNDDGMNASKIAISALQEKLPAELSENTAELHFQILPGDTNELREFIEGVLNTTMPDICIGIGQARGYNKIAVERMAKNLRYFVTPDRAGNTPKGIPVIEEGAIAYWHSLHDLDMIVPMLEDEGIPARVMNDCGTHLCNQAFYHCLHWKEKCKSSMQAGFIHIPALPEQVIKQWPEAPLMPLDMTCKALSLVVRSQLETAGRASGEDL